MTKERLKPYLTAVEAFGLAYGAAVGWGAFIMPASVFLPLGGPLGVAIGMTVGGLLMLLVGYNYHYMMNRQKDAGGTYSYTSLAFGKDHGFLSLWFLLLVYLAITWANVTALVLVFRRLMPGVLDFGFHYTIAGYDIYMGEVMIEIGAILVFGSIAMYRKKLIAKLQMVFAVFLLFGITVGLIGAFSAHGLELWSIAPKFSPENEPLLGVLGIIALAPWAFAGFESISNSTEEFKFDTKKTFTVMLIAVLVAIFSYVSLSFLAVSANPYAFDNWAAYFREVDGLEGISAVPVFHAMERFFGDGGLVLLALTLFCAIMTGLIGNTIAGSRLMYALARDNLLPRWFKEVTEEGSPKNTILFIMLLSLPIPFLGRAAISWIIDVNTIGATIAYAYTSAAALKIASVDHNKKVFVTGAAGLIVSICFFLYFMIPWEFSLATLASESYLILIAWSLLGFAIFRYVFAIDSKRQLGKSTVAWITLLAILIFSSMLWMRESLKSSVEDSLGYVYKFHISELKNHGIKADRIEQEEFQKFLDEMLYDIKRDLTYHNLFQLIILSIALYIMFILYSVMITREKRTEFERTLLEKENVAKSTFFFNMSHDIRTPMNAIIGYVNLLKKENLDAKTLDYLGKIETASDHLLSLINDILEVSRIENGKFTLEIVVTNIKKCIMEVKDLFKTQMEEKGLEYSVEVKVKKKWVAADGKRLNRVLLNLISNSYKFTEKGSVKVIVTEISKDEFLTKTGAYSKTKEDIALSKAVAEEMTKNNIHIAEDVKMSDKVAYYEIKVADTGRGMSDEFAATVFDAYARDRSVSDIQGTGLGMSITKSIIDMMGGEILVASKLGVGTTFTILLSFPVLEDVAREEESEKESAGEVKLEGLRVLLAEDVEMNREIATMILSEFEITVDAAENGKVALQKVIESEENPYDLILMDIQMPEMNGYDATRAIRELNNKTLADTPIIAMTANAFQEDVINAEKAGMNAHIAKPLDVPKMLETINEVLGKKSY